MYPMLPSPAILCGTSRWGRHLNVGGRLSLATVFWNLTLADLDALW